MENYKIIPGTNDMYLIDQAGNVYSKYRNRLLRWHDNGIGYKQVWLKDNAEHKGRWYKVHRLVLITFGPDPASDKHTDCNHIDGNKSNNHISNLQWVTKSENSKHAYDNGLHSRRGGMIGKKHTESAKAKQSLKKLGRDNVRWSGTWVTPHGKFDSIKRAAEAHNTYRNDIRRKCKGGLYRGWYFVPKPE